MWHVAIQGKAMQMRFLCLIGSVGKKAERAKRALTVLERIKENPNIDVLPKQLWEHIQYLWKEQGYTGRTFHTAMGWAYSGTQRMKSGVGRDRLAKIAKVLEDDALYADATSDVFWDEIISIEAVGVQEVFDATIPGVESFVANDVIVHNSISRTRRRDVFISRGRRASGT